MIIIPLHISDVFPASTTEWLNFTGYKHSKTHKAGFWFNNGWVDGGPHIPGILYDNGAKFYYLKGICHRNNDLPAILWPDGSFEWLVDGLYHRVKGPARLLKDLSSNCESFTIYGNSYGTLEYWVEGIQLTHNQFYQNY